MKSPYYCKNTLIFCIIRKRREEEGSRESHLFVADMKEWLTCLIFCLSDGGIISGERLCGGSRPLASFWFIRWSARANCSRVSFPMSPISHSSLRTNGHKLHKRIMIYTSGKDYFWLLGWLSCSAAVGGGQRTGRTVTTGQKLISRVKIKINLVWLSAAQIGEHTHTAVKTDVIIHPSTHSFCTVKA